MLVEKKSSNLYEKKYHFLIDNILDVIGELDLDGMINFVSPQVYDMLGYHPDEMIGTNFIKFIHPDDVPGIRKVMKKAIKSKEVSLPGLRLKHKKGNYVLVFAKGKLIKLNDKARLIGVIRDITESKIAEQKLKESEELFRTIFETAKDCIFIKDRSLQYIRINKAMEELFGVSSEDLVNKTDIELFGLEAGKHVMEIDQRVIQGEIVEEEPTKPINGIPHTFHTIKVPLKDIQGNIYGLCGFARDITDRKIFEQKLIESEEKYRLLFERANDAIFLLGSDGFIDTNDYILKMFGYNEKSEFIGLKPWKLSPHKQPDGRNSKEKAIEFIDNCLEGKPQRFYWKHSRKDGTPFDADVSLNRIFIENKYFVQAIVRDITDRIKSEEQIRESEEKYRDLLETAGMGIIEFDVEENKVSYINPKLLEILKYTKEELLDVKIFMQIVHPEDLKELIKSSEDKYVEFRIFTKEGKLKWLSGTRNNRFNKEGKWISARLWLEDSTESKEVEEIKSNLLTRFSHEFKTPLISIKGFADFLLTAHNKNLDDKTILFLKKIKDGGDRLKELINSFIESSHLDQALTKLKLHQENLSDLIKTSLGEMEGLINLRAHTINLDIHDQLIASVDKEKIFSVITNLILNAINYTPKGGKIWIQSIINEGSIIVSVKDNGIGLEDIEKKQLFKPFGKIERYGKGWDIVSEGMGMGLYLSKEIMNLHGGKIWVESEGGSKGSTFNFSLPIVTD